LSTPDSGQGPTVKDLEILLRERTRDLADALERLKTFEERGGARFDNAPFGFLTLNADLHVVYCNSAAGQIWGIRCDDLLGKSLWPTHNDERADALLQKRIFESLQQNKPDSFDAFSARSCKWLRVYTAPSDGRLLIYLRDITDDKKKDEIVTKLWREARSITDNSPDLILRFNEHLRCIFANKAVATLTGVSLQRSRGKTHDDIRVPWEISYQLKSALGRAMRTRAIQSGEFDLTTVAGKKSFSWHATPESSVDGRIRSVLVVARDVTAHKEEERVRARLTTAIEEAGEGVILVEPDGTITYVNEALCRITGRERTELKGAPISILGREAVDARVIQAIRESLSQNVPWSGRFEIRKKEGGELWCELHVSPVKNASGSITGFVGIAGDITRETELETQLRESQKLEAVGTLSGGIAHDFNNMLAVILGNAEIALDDVQDDSPIRHNLNQMLTAALRGRDLVKQILSFSRKSLQNVKPFPLAPLVKETTNLLRSTLPATTEIRLEIKTEEDTVVADPTQIQQVLMNLATNASQSMGEEGVMTVCLANVRFDTQNALPDPGLRIGEYLVLSIKDTGKGIDESIRQRIFEPFFSTKELGQGTGLGLSVVYGIVKTYEGAITVNSVPGKGAVFRVFLPKGHVTYAEETSHETPLLAGKGRILLVDDEESIVSTGQHVLSRLGYEVHTETDPEKALQAFHQDPGRFDLVITDQAMPRMAGLTLARHLLAKRPDIPIILSTGYSAVVNEKTARESGIREILMKPLTREELATTVKRVLTDRTT
jgi:PAS domain S-box-containing protein